MKKEFNLMQLVKFFLGLIMIPLSFLYSYLFSIFYWFQYKGTENFTW